MLKPTGFFNLQIYNLQDLFNLLSYNRGLTFAPKSNNYN